MNEIIPPTIPESFSAFAKAVANLAPSFGIKQFEMTIQPDYNKYLEVDRRIVGDMKIRFRATDGRGRPSKYLSIDLNTNLQVVIQNEPESYN